MIDALEGIDSMCGVGHAYIIKTTVVHCLGCIYLAI